jgi:hypothetical protein
MLLVWGYPGLGLNFDWKDLLIRQEEKKHLLQLQENANRYLVQVLSGVGEDQGLGLSADSSQLIGMYATNIMFGAVIKDGKQVSRSDVQLTVDRGYQSWHSDALVMHRVFQDLTKDKERKLGTVLNTEWSDKDFE